MGRVWSGPDGRCRWFELNPGEAPRIMWNNSGRTLQRLTGNQARSVLKTLGNVATKGWREPVTRNLKCRAGERRGLDGRARRHTGILNHQDWESARKIGSGMSSVWVPRWTVMLEAFKSDSWSSARTGGESAVCSAAGLISSPGSATRKCVRGKKSAGGSNETGQGKERERPRQQLALHISTHHPCSDSRRTKKCASVNLKQVSCSATRHRWSEARNSQCFARRHGSLVRGRYVSVPELVRPL